MSSFREKHWCRLTASLNTYVLDTVRDNGGGVLVHVALICNAQVGILLDIYICFYTAFAMVVVLLP